MEQPSSVSDSDANPAPPGYLRLTVNGRYAVACEWAVPVIRDLLSKSTLHDWAAAQTYHDQMHGRGVNYGVTLPTGSGPYESTAVVVRRNRHGGIFRSITGEFFRPPTRAPLELANALRLASAGVNTPQVIAYATYPAFMNLVRCDVVTRRLPTGGDFPDVWRNADTSARKELLAAVANLLKHLADAGAWHADLNLKNIYIALQGSSITPYVLDVDRVSFTDYSDIAERNFSRLARSARKWRTSRGLDFDENAIARLAALSREKT